jgi:RNA polymerase sigma factor for flagellar operon FliA
VTPTELVEAHIGLARKAARHARIVGLDDPDDAYSDALLGLWTAARRYDETRGVPFGSFAWPRMVGAVGDGRRERDHVSRAVRARGGVPVVASLDAQVYVGRDSSGHSLTLADVLPDPHDALEDADTAATDWERHVELARWVEQLPADDRYVIQGLLDGRTLAEIGAELGVTESRACQISSRATDRLRWALHQGTDAA